MLLGSHALVASLQLQLLWLWIFSFADFLPCLKIIIQLLQSIAMLVLLKIMTNLDDTGVTP
jgi:hypothetical protein